MNKSDYIFKNAKAISVDLEGKVTRSEAVAVAADRILAVGSYDEVKHFIDDDTKLIDCGGNTLLPGLCDAHCHPSASAAIFASCNLFDVTQEEGEGNEQVIDKYLDRLRSYISENPGLDVIRGNGWNRAFFNGSNGEDRMPKREDLDRVCRDRPIVLESYCLHNIWVNSKAIELAGITSQTKTPDTGFIERDACGNPSGIFEEAAAINLIKKNLPGYDYSVEQYKDVLLRYQRECASNYGITLVLDAYHTDNARSAYRELAEEGRLVLRARGVYTVDNSSAREDMDRALARKGNDNCRDLFRIDTVKMFMEGEMCMIEPYSREVNEINGNPPDYCGDIFWTREQGIEYMSEAIEAGFQVHMHSMGSRTTKLCIDCLEEAQKHSNGDNRNVIAHLTEVMPEDKERMGKLGIQCNCQPRWMVYDTDAEDFYTPYFGAERTMRFYPNKSLLDAGCLIAYGTDFPVTPPPDPFHEIQCALTRSLFRDAPDYERFEGRALGDGEEVDLIEAIKSLTINGAYQNHLENVTGSIEIGKSADLVLLDRDLEACPTDDIYSTSVIKTMFKGKIVYEV